MDIFLQQPAKRPLVAEKAGFGFDLSIFWRLFAIFWDAITSYYIEQVARGSYPVSEKQFTGQEDLAGT